MRARQRFARSPRAAGLRMTSVSVIRDELGPGFDLFFKLGLRNVSAWETSAE
jgi:hypothetical protein